MRQRQVARPLGACRPSHSGQGARLGGELWASWLLEGTGFALAAGSYLYLYSASTDWPLSATAARSTGRAPSSRCCLLASLAPNFILSRYAEKCAIVPYGSAWSSCLS